MMHQLFTVDAARREIASSEERERECKKNQVAVNLSFNQSFSIFVIDDSISLLYVMMCSSSRSLACDWRLFSHIIILFFKLKSLIQFFSTKQARYLSLSPSPATEKSSNFHGWARIGVRNISFFSCYQPMKRFFSSSEMKSNRDIMPQTDEHETKLMFIDAGGEERETRARVESDENDLFILQSDKKNINICMQTIPIS